MRPNRANDGVSERKLRNLSAAQLVDECRRNRRSQHRMFACGGAVEHGAVVCHDTLAQSDFRKDVQDIRQQTPGY